MKPEPMRYQPMLPPPVTALGWQVAPAFTGMAVLEASAGCIYPRHQHRDYEVIIPLRGRYRCRLADALVSLGSEQALVVAPGDWHEDLLQAGNRHVGVWFNLGRTPLLAPGAEAAMRIATLPTGKGGDLVARLLAEHRHGDGFSPRIQEALCHELFWQLVRTLPRAGLAPGFLAATEDDDFRRRLDELFEAHHRRPLPLAAMAAALHVSERTLGARCLRLTGLAPAKAFARHRLEHARSLLRGTGLSVKEVAAHLGFSDQHHFCRAFKAWFGHPPSARNVALRNDG